MSANDEMQPAWILHTRPYRETSILVEALTLHEGRVGLVARGVRGPRSQSMRAALQPLQALQIRMRGDGDLRTLSGFDVLDHAVALTGHALLSAFYVNELLIQLVPRQQPYAGLFLRYALCINGLADPARVGWTLRRFERDLLQSLGYGLPLARDARSGEPITAEDWYRVDPERGALPVRPGGADAVSGGALLALATDREPSPSQLVELRALMRRVIDWRLGGRELVSRRVLFELERPLRSHTGPPAGS